MCYQSECLKVYFKYGAKNINDSEIIHRVLKSF